MYETDNAMKQSVQRRLDSLVIDLPRIKDLLDEGQLTFAALDNSAPILSACTDQASYQTSASSFLKYAKDVNLFNLWDPAAHRVHNDWKLAMSDARLTATVYCTTTLFNFITGPAKSAGRWLANIQETLLDLKATMTSNDSLLKAHWVDICKERGWFEPHETDEAAMAAYLKDLPICKLVRAQGEAISLARWLSYPRGEKERRRHWTENQFILLCWSLTTGAVSRRWQVWKSCGNFEPPQPPSEDAPVGVSSASTSACPMQAAGENMGEMYKRCKNQLHVCLELAANPDLKHRSRRIGILSEPCAKHHGMSLKRMKTKEGSLEYYYQAATWGHMQELFEFFEVLTDMTKLAEMGLDTKPHSKLPGVKPISEESLLAEDMLAAEIWQLSFALLSRRSCTHATHAAAYPLMLGGVITEDGVKMKGFLSGLKADCQKFRVAEKSNDQTVINLVKRSVMREPIMKVVSACVCHEKCTPGVLDIVAKYIKQPFCGVGTSKMCEDNNKEAVSAMTRKQESKVMSRTRRTMVPVVNNIVGRWGRPNGSTSNSTLPTPSRRPEESMFMVSQALKQSDKLHVDGILQEPTWPTTQPVDFVSKACEQSLIFHLVDTKTMDIAANYWVSSLMPQGEICQHVPSDTFVLVLRVVRDAGLLVWPYFANDSLFVPDKPKKLEFRHVDDIKEWKVVPTHAASPKRVRSEADLAGKPYAMCLTLRRTGAPMDLIEWHAKSGFALLHSRTIQHLFEDYDLNVDQFGKLETDNIEVAQATALMLKLFPAWTRADISHALARGRQSDESEDTSLLQPIIDDLELLAHVVPQNEANSWKSCVQGQRNKKLASTSRVASDAKIFEKCFPIAQAALAKAKAKPAKPKVYSATARKRFIGQLDAGEHRVLEEFRPPSVRINVEEDGTLFRLVHSGKRVSSFSWHLRGKAMAMSLALEAAWELARARDGLVVPDQAWLYAHA